MPSARSCKTSPLRLPLSVKLGITKLEIPSQRREVSVSQFIPVIVDALPCWAGLVGASAAMRIETSWPPQSLFKLTTFGADLHQQCGKLLQHGFGVSLRDSAVASA